MRDSEEHRPDPNELGLPEAVRCPFCEQDDTELHSPFGGQASMATYWCHRCHTAFDWIKWRAARARSDRPPP